MIRLWMMSTEPAVLWVGPGLNHRIAADSIAADSNVAPANVVVSMMVMHPAQQVEDVVAFLAILK